MLRVGRILKDFADAGSVNSMLAPWAFVDDRIAEIAKAFDAGDYTEVRRLAREVE